MTDESAEFLFFSRMNFTRLVRKRLKLKHITVFISAEYEPIILPFVCLRFVLYPTLYACILMLKMHSISGGKE